MMPSDRRGNAKQPKSEKSFKNTKPGKLTKLVAKHEKDGRTTLKSL